MERNFNHKILEKTPLKSSFSMLETKLQQHQSLRYQACTNPTKELLEEAIAKDYPHIVQLIIESKLEPVDYINNLNLKIVETISPTSARILTDYLAFAKFKMLPMQSDLPFELVGYIEKFVHSKKN